MSQTVQIAEQQIKDAVTAAAAAAVHNGQLPAGQLPPFILEIPQDRSHGDYAVNVSEWTKYLVTGVHKEYQ